MCEPLSGNLHIESPLYNSSNILITFGYNTYTLDFELPHGVSVNATYYIPLPYIAAAQLWQTHRVLIKHHTRICLRADKNMKVELKYVESVTVWRESIWAKSKWKLLQRLDLVTVPSE
jgi:hypothetical protein